MKSKIIAKEIILKEGEELNWDSFMGRIQQFLNSNLPIISKYTAGFAKCDEDFCVGDADYELVLRKKIK